MQIPIDKRTQLGQFKVSKGEWWVCGGGRRVSQSLTGNKIEEETVEMEGDTMCWRVGKNRCKHPW